MIFFNCNQMIYSNTIFSLKIFSSENQFSIYLILKKKLKLSLFVKGFVYSLTEGMHSLTEGVHETFVKRTLGHFAVL